MKAKILTIGKIIIKGEETIITGWEIDCINNVPPFQVFDDGTILFGGWDIEILKLMSNICKQ